MRACERSDSSDGSASQVRADNQADNPLFPMASPNRAIAATIFCQSANEPVSPVQGVWPWTTIGATNRAKHTEKSRKMLTVGVRSVRSVGAKFTNVLKDYDLWCRGTESNCRHQPFQGIREMKKLKTWRW